MGLNRYFPATSKEFRQLSYLNLRIILSPYGIIIDHTSHIEDTVIAQWFPEASDKFNSDSITFKSDSTFEIALSETLPDTPDELHILEDTYLVKSSAHIRKFSIICNIPALISFILSAVPEVVLLTHQHHPTKVLSTSYVTYLYAYTIPSCIPLDLMVLTPMTSVKRLPQSTSNLKRYPIY